MATLAELYEFLEKIQDDKQIDRTSSMTHFHSKNDSKHGLRFFSWWEIERLVEDENCLMDKDVRCGSDYYRGLRNEGPRWLAVDGLHGTNRGPTRPQVHNHHQSVACK